MLTKIGLLIVSAEAVAGAGNELSRAAGAGSALGLIDYSSVAGPSAQ
jgi:hypothetical protein